MQKEADAADSRRHNMTRNGQRVACWSWCCSVIEAGCRPSRGITRTRALGGAIGCVFSLGGRARLPPHFGSPRHAQPMAAPTAGARPHNPRPRPLLHRGQALAYIR